MLKKLVFMIVAVALAATASAQQTPKKEPAKESTKKEAPAKPAPEPPGLPINVKIDVSITDQTGTAAPAKKVVTMLTTDRQSNSIRSTASVPVKTSGGPSFNYRNVTSNGVAGPTIVTKQSTKVLVAFGLEYLPRSAGGAEGLEPGRPQLNERLSLVLESGKPMIVSLAADPMSDRKITVEVTATILK